jgi:tetratricopeptide (TPR) repeat protein
MTSYPTASALRFHVTAARSLLVRLFAACALALVGAHAGAADTPDPAPAASGDKLAPARALIADNKWVAAIDALKKVNDTGSADWNNLMGYSHRKAKKPDYVAAERYYDEALRINAQHKGALEYSGELYLMIGNLAKAESRLAALEKVCGTGCEEYKDLHEAIGSYKAHGNKVVGK